jgi:hypothetical protein
MGCRVSKQAHPISCGGTAIPEDSLRFVWMATEREKQEMYRPGLTIDVLRYHDHQLRKKQNNENT